MGIRWLLTFVALLAVSTKFVEGGIYSLVHDLIQNNVAGIPVIHEKTEWDFHPDDGKARRAQYVALNGWRGQDLIDRLGNGAGFRGPWGVKVQNSKPDLRHIKR